MTDRANVVSDGLWALYGPGETIDVMRPCQGQPGCMATPVVMARFLDGSYAGGRRFHLELCEECALPVLVELQRLGKAISPAHNTIAAGAGRGRGKR